MEKELINNRFLEAVKLILEQKIEKNKTALAKSLGLKASKFSEILNGRMMAGTDLLSLLCQKYQVNPSWLLLGVNYIFTEETKNINLSNNISILDKYSELLIEHGKILKENELLKQQNGDLLRNRGQNVLDANSSIVHVG